MPYENIVAPVLLILVLLAPLLKWAKDRWMSVTIPVLCDSKSYRVSGNSLATLVKNLHEQSGCESQVAEAIIRNFAISELQRKGAWAILAEIAGMTEEDYLCLAVRTGIITELSQLPMGRVPSSVRSLLVATARKTVTIGGGSASPKR